MLQQTRPLLYKRGGYWCISPSGNRKDVMHNIIASKTFQGASKLAKQCYNPLRVFNADR